MSAKSRSTNIYFYGFGNDLRNQQPEVKDTTAG
jgi:hypothetical protein